MALVQKMPSVGTNVSIPADQTEKLQVVPMPSSIMQPAWQIEGKTIAWADNEEGHYQIPFVYSCNARPFVKQLAEQSGTWFRDVRELETWRGHCMIL